MSTLLQYKCPCCGGSIEFNSSAQKMKCPYCDTEFDVEALRAYDEDLKRERPDDMTWETENRGIWKEEEASGMVIYTCKSCGGEIITDRNTVATSCPFCTNPVIMTGQLSGDLRPDYVIPFKLDKEAAKDGLLRHLKGKRLLPKQFKDQNHIDEIKGIYVPFWLFDADTEGEIRYKATKVRAWSDSDYNYTETKYYSVFRAGTIGFERVPVDGSSKMPDELMESIEPFDFRDAVDFQTAYLMGYLADRYDVTNEQSVGRANERIKKSTEQSFANTVQGYTTVMPESSSIRLKNGKVKYALYPVWLLNTSWKGKQYTFVMNGQTGKFIGNLPVDNAAYWRWFIALSVVFGAAAYFCMWLIHFFN